MIRRAKKKQEVSVRGLRTLILGITVALGSVSTTFAASLTTSEAQSIFSACKTTAASTASPIRGTSGTKMWCAVLDREGKTLLIQATDTGESPGPSLNTDAWRASIEIAEAKAYTALGVSSNDAALNSKQVGLLSRPDGCLNPLTPCNTDIPGSDGGPAPLWGVGNTNPFRPGVGDPALSDDKAGSKHHGIVTFAGGQPVYSCARASCAKPCTLLGGVGVSGDGVDQDDAVAKGAVTGAGFCLGPQ
jgi:uncharacterized protein GlcG (DUF336 family)